jgi:hypothetical protein
MHLDGAGVEAVAAALTGTASDQALASLREAARFAIALGDRLRAPGLVLQALVWAPEELPAHRAAATAALLRRRGGPDLPGRRDLRALLGSDPAWAVYLDVVAGEEPSLDDGALVGLGALGVEVLDRRLSRALEEGDLKHAQRLADQLVKADRWHLRARVAGALLDDPVLEAARARLDGLSDGAEPALMGVLVQRVAARLDPADLRRLERARTLLQGQPAAARAIDAHALGCGGKERPGAAPLLERWRSARLAPAMDPSPGDQPLAARLPSGWSYMRLGQPGAFVAAVTDLARRLWRRRRPRRLDRWCSPGASARSPTCSPRSPCSSPLPSSRRQRPPR